ncbi:hypothetical protein [Maritalea porphyrae]|jgi:hypothetical protein|uniref:hypothetical protein n=1 Tax=Maritalea porphyrae TaxID=880732 RepID=UPI0022B063DC|nr:hypothetical protein [Maritalea porphyrae]MCZ4272699.1 hypothetical protein [Maritalea porphyrae]
MNQASMHDQQLTTRSSSSVPAGHSWPISKPYDVVFYRSYGPKSNVNVAFQHVFDLDAFKSDRKFTHCALVGSELTAIEAYPRAVKGYYTDMVHPGGVRFVPVIDLCYDSQNRYRDFLVLRAPGLTAPDTSFGAESMMKAWRYIESKYGLRRFLGIGRGPRDSNAKQIKEWLSCSDLVLKVLADAGRFDLQFQERVTPSGLVATLGALGWQDVTEDYAPQRFEAKSRQYMQRFGLTGGSRAGVDLYALKMAWSLGTFAQSIQRQQYMVEEYINRRLSNVWPDGLDAGRYFEKFTADHAMRVLRQIKTARREEFSQHIDPLLAELSQKRHVLK